MTDAEKAVFEAKAMKAMDTVSTDNSDTCVRSWDIARQTNPNSKTIKMVDTLLDEDDDKVKLVNILSGIEKGTLEELYRILWKISKRMEALESIVVKHMEERNG